MIRHMTVIIATQEIFAKKTSKYAILAFFRRKEICFALCCKFNYLQLLYNSGALLLIAVDFLLRKKFKICDVSHPKMQLEMAIMILVGTPNYTRQQQNWVASNGLRYC